MGYPMTKFKMKLSTITKQTAASYTAILKAQIESDIGLVLKGKTLSPIRQAYENKLHMEERARIKSICADVVEKAKALGVDAKELMDSWTNL